jgi:thiosulfate/3-mercaptopyruvate sulfurtransferase
MILKVDKPLVSVYWLKFNLGNKNLIIFDCTIAKVTAKSSLLISKEKEQIKGAVFFDIKKEFSDLNSTFPNTVLSTKEFEKKAQSLGVNNNSCIVVYDDLGIYSSPRVWWMFNLMGFKNIAVLDGGFPEWKSKKYSIEKPIDNQLKKGNFKVNYQSEKIKLTKDILASINNQNILIADARSNGRFNSTEPEPRNDVKSGHIPNSISLPFTSVLEEGKMKSIETLKDIFNELNSINKAFVFSCGTGIKACILSLGAEVSGIKNISVYDGSWTEWGSTEGLPIND